MNWRSVSGCPRGRAADRAAGVSALALAHSRGIIHRDLKPANIVAHVFGGGDEVYKVVDFGVATVRQSGDETRLTGSQQFIGTVAYAPPSSSPVASSTPDRTCIRSASCCSSW